MVSWPTEVTRARSAPIYNIGAGDKEDVDVFFGGASFYGPGGYADLPVEYQPCGQDELNIEDVENTNVGDLTEKETAKF
jgi:hypothetical protein